MRNKKIIMAGGTGFIGQGLAKRWAKDNRVIILSRRSAADIHSDSAAVNNAYSQGPLTARDGYNITYWHWDGRTVEKHWAAELEGADLVINLAGRSVNCRYTARNRQEISDSRADATRALGQAIRETTVPPKLWVNTSSATIYRHAQDGPQDEYNGEIENDFSVRVCKRRERTFEEQRTPFTRQIAIRLAITLGEDGPLVPYLRLVKFGLGGRQGDGRQMLSAAGARTGVADRSLKKHSYELVTRPTAESRPVARSYAPFPDRKIHREHDHLPLADRLPHPCTLSVVYPRRALFLSFFPHGVASGA